jgi:hypothetical protein
MKRWVTSAGALAALLLAASQGVASTSAGPNETAVQPPERRPGFSGFPQWDSRLGQLGGRLRSAEEQPPGKSFGGQSKDDQAKWMELAKQLYEKFKQEQGGGAAKEQPKGKGDFGGFGPGGKGKGWGGFGPGGKGKAKGEAAPQKGKQDDYAKWMELAKQLYDKFAKEKAAPAKKEFAKKEFGKKEFAKKEAPKGPAWAEMAKKQFGSKDRPWTGPGKAAPKGKGPMDRFGGFGQKRGGPPQAAGRFAMGSRFAMPGHGFARGKGFAKGHGQFARGPAQHRGQFARGPAHHKGHGFAASRGRAPMRGGHPAAFRGGHGRCGGGHHAAMVNRGRGAHYAARPWAHGFASHKGARHFGHASHTGGWGSRVSFHGHQAYGRGGFGGPQHMGGHFGGYGGYASYSPYHYGYAPQFGHPQAYTAYGYYRR